MIKVQYLNPQPIFTIPHEFPEKEGSPAQGELPVLNGLASGLPRRVEALILASDLCGTEPSAVARGTPRPLGVVAAEWLQTLALSGMFPDTGRTGVMLAGDFYVARPQSGWGGNAGAEVVWRAFGESMRWVAGVRGDYDVPAGAGDGGLAGPGGYHLLDGAATIADSIGVAGLGGVTCPDAGPHVIPEPEYMECLKSLVAENPDVLILHESPDGRRDGCKGSAAIRDSLEALDPLLVLSGHTHWTEPLVGLDNGGQVLNVAGRVVVLLRGS